MSITHSPDIRNDIAALISSMIDANGNGKFNIYSGTFTNLLATFTLPNPSFGAAANGTITANAITPVTATASDTAASFTLTDGANTVILQGSVGVAGSGADCILNTTTLVSGGSLSINSFTYAAPV